MGWIHIDTNTVSAIGRLIFRKRERFEDFWTLSFTNRSDVMSAYAENVTAANQPIVFTNKTNSANVGNIKVHIFEETTFGTTPVGDNFSWSSSGTNVNVAANGTYSYQGITHTSIADEFYYDGTSHGVSPYSGTLDGAHSYRIQFIYTDTATGKEYLSDFYDFGSHYYYTQPFASFEQAIRRDVDLVFTASAPSGTYDLGDTIVGTLTATNTYPYACTLGFIAPDGVTLSQSIFENVSSDSTVTTTFEYTIAEEDIIRGYKTFDFGGSIGNVSMNPIDINSQTVSCTVQTEPVRAHMSLEFTLTTPTPQEGFDYDDSIAYSIVLTNDGNVTLQGEVGTEKMENLWSFASLSPGSSLPFSTEGNNVITEADIIEGFATIDFHASGENLDSGESFTINDYDTLSTVAIVDNVTITITTEEDAPTEGWHLGQEINYIFNIENTGNTSLRNITVECELTGDTWTFDLALGVSETLPSSYRVVEDNILNGNVLCEVIVTADSWDSDNPEYTTSEHDSQLVEDCNPILTFTPTRSIDKTTYYEDDAIKWNLLVTNTGNLTVNNLEIWNLTTNVCLTTIDQFRPGDSEIIEDDYWINNQDALLGELTFRWEAKGVALNEENVDVICTDTFTTSQTTPSYVLTVYYRKENLDGDFIQTDVKTTTFQKGDSVWITTPTEHGFTILSGQEKVGSNSMPARNVTITVLYRREVHTVTINYSCTNSNVTMPSNYEESYKYRQSYSIEVPIIPGYIPSQEVITGTMDTFNQTYFVKYYSANQYCRLIVRYYRLELDGSYTSLTSGMYAPVTKFIEHGGTYNIKSPSMTNYTPDLAVVSGTLNEDKEINVYYNRPRHQLIIHYYMQQSDGTYVLDDSKTSSQWYWEGSSYSKTTESITGYTADTARVTGTMGNQDTVVDVHYDLITYSFTVHYRKIDGPSAHPDITVTGTVLDSDKYIISPAVEGYQAGNKYIKWHPGSDVSSIIVTYTTITSGSWVEITDGNYVTTSAPYAFTVRTTIDGQSSFVDDQDTVVFLQPFTIYVWTGCNVTVHWEGSSYVPSTWSGYIQEVSWNNGSGTQTKIYDNATDSFTITSNNNIFASTNFTERQ